MTNSKIGFAAAVTKAVEAYGDDSWWACNVAGLTPNQKRFGIDTPEHFDGWLMREAQAIGTTKKVRGARFGLASKRRAPLILVRGWGGDA